MMHWTRSLSRKSRKLLNIYLLHIDCFLPQYRSTSSHNRKVLEEIMAEIMSSTTSTNLKAKTARGNKRTILWVVSLQCVCVVAVKHCYENQRRFYLEQKEEREGHVEYQSQRRKYRSRRERVSLYFVSLGTQAFPVYACMEKLKWAWTPLKTGKA